MELHQLDLNLLRVFDVVYAQSNLSKAAKELGISQSAVSNALGRLRDALGQPLFVRAGQGVAATTYADSIAPQVRQALSLLQSALQEASFNYRLSNRRFTLICSDYSAAVVLPAVMARVQQLAPGVTLHIVAKHDSGDFAAALAKGEADLAIGGLPFLTGPTRHQRLFDERMVLLGRRQHPATRSRLGLQVLNRYPHVLVNPYGHWLPWEQLKQKDGVEIEPHIAVRVPTYLAALFLLEQSDYLTSCPKRLANLLVTRFPLVEIKLPMPLAEIPVGQYWHERAHEDPGHQWLRQQVHEVCLGM